MYEWNAEDYARHSRGQEVWARELLSSLELRPDDCVLDIGSGDGRITNAIAERVPQGRVVGVDSSADMVRHARAEFAGGRQRNLTFMQADASALPFDSEFSVIYSSATLHWVLDHRPVIAGIAHALRPGGRLVAQMGGFGCAATVIAAFDEVAREPPWSAALESFTPRYGFHRPDDYERWLTEAGFAVSESRLIPKDMVHRDREALVGWIRTAWHPYTNAVAAPRRARFIEEVAGRYLAAHPPDASGAVHVPMVRLQVRAKRLG
ncbi:MAG: class I SAM-dependent methyltransferase [Steroidobacteraceae bacterium]